VAASYGTLACALTWPLPLYLRTRLLGDPAGDLGVYIWNVWIFRHELIRHAHLPFSTDHVFGMTGAADFSLHNFTPIAGALGTPLVGPLGVVATFNLVMLVLMAATGIGTFALARQLGLGRGASWWAGALFMAAPVLTARETAHFSLVIAAPLPLFLWALLRTLDRLRVRDAVLVGAIAALATYSDAYYGIYCALMGAVVVSWRFLRVCRPERPTPWPRVAWVVNLAMGVLVLIVAARLAAGPTAIALGPVDISLRSLYTPLLLLTVAVAFRVWLRRRPGVAVDDDAGTLPSAFRLGLIAVATCLVLLLPELVGITLRYTSGRLPDTPVYWRSSPRGLDLLAYFVPNPTHAWFGDHTRSWFMPPVPDAFPEFVGAFSLVALALVAVGLWYRLLPNVWVIFTAAFLWLSLGPFVHVAGVNTNIIGPWALLRYVPVIGMARSPARFAIVAALGLSLLAAFALARLRERGHWRSAWIAPLVAALLAFELLPAPRPLHSAAVPDVYSLVAADATYDEVGRLLELPTGVKDGTSSAGNFSALSSYFQTSHRRPMIGGYLSRVSSWRKAEKRRLPMFGALMTLSEGGSLGTGEAQRARNARDAFLARSCTRFVLVDRHRASVALHDFAVSSLRLTPVRQDRDYALYTPVDPPPCRPPLPESRRLTDVSWLWAPAE
jgi:hypothetical protein